MTQNPPLLFAEYALPEHFTPSAFQWKEGMLVAGVDEVGRGPLVGDVVTAAVVLDPAKPVSGLADSKKLSEKKRVQLAEEIRAAALGWALGRASPDEIDEINILHATMLAMRRAVSSLQAQLPDVLGGVLVDGNRTPEFGVPAEPVVKGDGRIPAISAASILAKVVRDGEMQELDKQYPEYGFARHKGYPTREHLDALKRLGPLAQHRKSFGPVAAVISQGTLF